MSRDFAWIPPSLCFREYRGEKHSPGGAAGFWPPPRPRRARHVEMLVRARLLPAIPSGCPVLGRRFPAATARHPLWLSRVGAAVYCGCCRSGWRRGHALVIGAGGDGRLAERDGVALAEVDIIGALGAAGFLFLHTPPSQRTALDFFRTAEQDLTSIGYYTKTTLFLSSQPHHPVFVISYLLLVYCSL